MSNNRNKRLLKNTGTSMLLQLVTVICGFVLPRAILKNYGSDVNGLINSMTQFLQAIAFLELGVGSVVQSSLYTPIANKDIARISEIVTAGNSFFRKIAIILVAYVAILCYLFPVYLGTSFDVLYNIELILALSGTFFVQYYFGIVDRLFLNASQKGYIQNLISIITLIFNTALCYILINLGFSIQVVKLTTSVIFIIRPIIVRLYINKYYRINRKVKCARHSIPQKWNGIAQHIAAIVLDGTDIIVLNVFSSLHNISIYSVYNIVVSGIKQLFLQSFNGVMPLFGELWAKKEFNLLNHYFEMVEMILHIFVVSVWSCVYILIVPFVLLYTKGVNDTNYNVPEFALLISLSGAICCLRLTYNSMILAVGHYKQTQHIFIIAAAINVVVSIITVNVLGLIGVAIGTIAAMLYQTISMQYYCIKKLKIHSYVKFLKQICIDSISLLGIYLLTTRFKMAEASWIEFVIFMIKTGMLSLTVILLVNYMFYKKNCVELVLRISQRDVR